MSVERELLVEALEWMEELNYFWSNSRISGDYDLLELIADINKIEKLLAQPEQEHKPFAWIDAGSLKSLQESTGYALRYLTNDTENLNVDDVPLYLAPPTREPLSDDVICDGLPQTRVPDYAIRTFIKGVKFAEKMHGITGVDDDANR